MNIRLTKVNLVGVERELKRIADCLEIFLSLQGYHVRPPVADTSGQEPEVLVTDEAENAILEAIEVSRGKPLDEREEEKVRRVLREGY